MDTIVPVSLMVVGMALVAALSAALYVRLPKAIFASASRHGRYAGLGLQKPSNDTPAGNTPVGMDLLHGQTA